MLSRVISGRLLTGVKKPLVQSPRLWQVIDKAPRPCMALGTVPGFFTAPHAHGSVLCCSCRACAMLSPKDRCYCLPRSGRNRRLDGDRVVAG